MFCLLFSDLSFFFSSFENCPLYLYLLHEHVLWPRPEQIAAVCPPWPATLQFCYARPTSTHTSSSIALVAMLASMESKESVQSSYVRPTLYVLLGGQVRFGTEGAATVWYHLLVNLGELISLVELLPTLQFPVGDRSPSYLLTHSLTSLSVHRKNILNVAMQSLTQILLGTRPATRPYGYRNQKKHMHPRAKSTSAPIVVADQAPQAKR